MLLKSKNMYWFSCNTRKYQWRFILQNAISAVFKREQDQEEIGYSLTVL